ncbi:armadillo-type protein [Cladochytrium replicatum]|nr:armadillo-type protein [Cladochytrium replicatum]
MEGRGSPPTGEQVELTVIRLVALLSHSRRAVRASCIAALNSLLGPMRLVRGEFSPTVAGWAELARRTLKLADFQTILCNFCSDYDAIVRAAALRSLLQINDLSNDLLPQLRENYSLFVSMLKDFSEEVRELAMMIIWRIGVTPLDSTEPSPLEDDAFVKICGCVNDGDLHVRAAAFRLLGTFRKVSEQLLIQTLQKSVIQQHRGSTNVKQPGRIGQWKQRSIPSESTETTGDVDIDAPNTGPPTLVAVTETQLKTGTIGASVSFAGSAWSDFLPVDAQACGAFVHGLEDEYELVRNTAVDAMRELCLASQAFADKALFCFIDMFNDEMHSVRLNSVKSFRAIVNPPDDEQQVESDAMDTGSDEEASKRGGVIVDGLHRLRNILMVLHDADKAVRLEGHRMCSGVCVRNLQDLNVFINELMRNIRRHPDDLISVYECLRDVGRNHPKLIGKQVDRFFNLDPRFTVSEINMEDRAHIGNMILVFNAASEEEGSKSVDAMNSSYILGRVPTYAFRHYLYMRDQYPGCFPAIVSHFHLAQ